LEGFTPAAMPVEAPDRLRLAFCLEGTWQPVQVDLRADSGRVHGTFKGEADADDVLANVARILSLDVDGSDFMAVGQRDPVVKTLQDRYPGLRPVGFWSAYEAAAWAVLSQRIRMQQAAGLKRLISERLGHRFDDGSSAFPAPARLLSLDNLTPIPAIKVGRLRSIAHAAADGTILSSALRAVEPDTALDTLRRLPGIGPFSAELILVRGAMTPDVFPSAEGRLHDSMRGAYNRPDASVAELAEIAAGWRPFRTWVSVLFRTAREDQS
jgi:DNA-3-methyladenine glycosylase II